MFYSRNISNHQVSCGNNLGALERKLIIRAMHVQYINLMKLVHLQLNEKWLEQFDFVVCTVRKSVDLGV